MVGAPEPGEQETTNVVPLRREADQLPEEDGTGWRAAARRLQTQEPAVYSSWFAPLQSVGLESGILTLVAPSIFVADYVKTHFQSRILAALLADDRSIREVLIIPPQR